MGAEAFFEREDHEEIKALENLRNTSGTRIEEVKALKSTNMLPQTYEMNEKSEVSLTISPIKEVVQSQQRILEDTPDNHFKPSPSPVKHHMVVVERETATSPIKARQSRRSRQKQRSSEKPEIAFGRK